MAVDRASASPTGSGRRFVVGLNVLVMTALAAGLMVAVQALAYQWPKRWDMTSTSVNSLSSGTESLLRNLKTNVTLTSLYFQTDIEEEDQSRYRQAVDNLLALYQSTNRSHVATRSINALSDHDGMRNLRKSLRDKSAYKDDIEKYSAAVKEFKDDIGPKIATLLQAESNTASQLTSGLGESAARKVLSPVENLFAILARDFELIQGQVDAYSVPDDPQYTTAIGELKRLYRSLSDKLKQLANYGTQEAGRNPDLGPDAIEFLRASGSRSGELVIAMEENLKTLEALEPLRLDEIMRELRPNGNALLVETPEEALVVTFEDVWPPIDESATGHVPFSRRAFKGEERLTSAMLRLTQKQQTAVLFVRYGGPPLLTGGFMGQAPAPYGGMKRQLEDANFVVEEWDLKTSTTPPAIEPPPTRTLFVVLKPNPPERGPMGQQGQDPPFGEQHRQALLSAMGEESRALFIAGWEPSPPMGGVPIPIPSSYEFNDYLRTTWGVSVDTSALLARFASIAPGKYVPERRDFFNLDAPEVADHEVSRGSKARPMSLPWCAPLSIAEKLPDGVKLTVLLTQPRKDGVWGIKNIQEYQKQQTQQEYLTKVEGDLEGPYTLAVAGEKGKSKIVLISSRDFAEDAVALARVMVLTAEGFASRSVYPGNVTLFVNALHWLNDRTDLLDVGKPIDVAVLEVSGPTVTVVKVISIFVWPALALVAGGMAWWLRRN